MADWANWSEGYDWIIKRYDDVYSTCTQIQTKYTNAWNYYQAGNDHLALGQVITAMPYIINALKYCTAAKSGQVPLYPISYCLNFLYIREPEIPEYVLTWKAICEAWIKDDFAGRAPTIAIIDRMRQIIWDEPFYVVWAAKPEQQEF